MSRPRLDLAGKKFGRLYVVAFSHTEKYGGGSLKSFWKCRCDCGNMVVRCGPLLKHGHYKSCGCLNDERIINASQHSKHTLYHIWQGMISRCYSQSNPQYSYYGERGISVCNSWRKNFKQFSKDVGLRPGLDYSLDRIDNDGNYEPGNVRWATDKTQANNRRGNLMFTFNGITMTSTEWSDKLGLKRNVIYARLKRGWSIEMALSRKHYERHKLKTA